MENFSLERGVFLFFFFFLISYLVPPIPFSPLSTILSRFFEIVFLVQM